MANNRGRASGLGCVHGLCTRLSFEGKRLSKVLKGFIRLLIACVKFVGGYSIGFMYYIVTRVLQ